MQDGHRHHPKSTRSIWCHRFRNDRRGWVLVWLRTLQIYLSMDRLRNHCMGWNKILIEFNTNLPISFLLTLTQHAQYWLSSIRTFPVGKMLNLLQPDYFLIAESWVYWCEAVLSEAFLIHCGHLGSFSEFQWSLSVSKQCQRLCNEVNPKLIQQTHTE